MERWREVWRRGFVPQLTLTQLETLRSGLQADDPCLIQNATTDLWPVQCQRDMPVKCACAVGYAGWKAEGLQTVEEVQAFFARVCYGADAAIGEPAGNRHFLNWFDDTPREFALPALLAEVQQNIAHRLEALERGAVHAR